MSEIGAHTKKKPFSLKRKKCIQFLHYRWGWKPQSKSITSCAKTMGKFLCIANFIFSLGSLEYKIKKNCVLLSNWGKKCFILTGKSSCMVIFEVFFSVGLFFKFKRRCKWYFAIWFRTFILMLSACHQEISSLPAARFCVIFCPWVN